MQRFRTNAAISMISLRTSCELQVYVQRGFIWGLRISLSALFKSDSNYFNVFYGIIVFHNKDFIYIYILFFFCFRLC